MSRLREHALELAAWHGVAVVEDGSVDPDLPGVGPHSDVEAWVVTVLPIVDGPSYVVALHEIGHLVVPGDGLVGEGRAWGFVLDESVVPVDRRLALSWWGSHILAAGGELRVGGCELVGDDDLVEYLAAWWRVAYPNA